MIDNAPYVPTKAILIRNNGDDFTVADSVPSDGVAVITFCGELTDTEHMANTYGKTGAALLRESGIQGVSVYSVAYDFGSSVANLERAQMFRNAGRRLELAVRPDVRAHMEEQLKRMRENEPTPRYITQIYDKIIRPRMTTRDGLKIPANILAARMRGLVLYGHSHGGAVIRALGAYMRDQMRNAGYSPTDIKHVQTQVLAVLHAPTAPLEHPQFTTVSFVSADDTRADAYNKFSEFMYENSANIVPSFFNILGANVFIAGHLKTGFAGEHDPTGLLNHESTNEKLTDDGKIIFAVERNVITNGVRGAMAGSAMPDVATLAAGDGIDFDQMRRNGEYIYNLMMNDLRKQNPKHGHQK